MALRQITVTLPAREMDRILALSEEVGIIDASAYRDSRQEERATVTLLVDEDGRQALLDRLQGALDGRGDWRITLLSVETTIPFPEEDAEEDGEAGDEETRKTNAGLSREEIYDAVWDLSKPDRNYIVFVVLSTVVAAFGMIADNIAVVVGGMVTAPLLGPNLALAVGVALGDGRLMGRAVATNAAGIALAFGLSFGIAMIWPIDPRSSELLARSEVGFDGIAVALASGAAAALSLVSGLSSALVGVMVAVALLPPTAAVGIFLGTGHGDLALGAALLLAVNVVCVNLAAQAVMLTRGITPRTFFERKQARRATLVNGAIWLGLLLALAALLWLRSPAVQ